MGGGRLSVCLAVLSEALPEVDVFGRRLERTSTLRVLGRQLPCAWCPADFARFRASRGLERACPSTRKWFHSYGKGRMPVSYVLPHARHERTCVVPSNLAHFLCPCRGQHYTRLWNFPSPAWSTVRYDASSASPILGSGSGSSTAFPARPRPIESTSCFVLVHPPWSLPRVCRRAWDDLCFGSRGSERFVPGTRAGSPFRSIRFDRKRAPFRRMGKPGLDRTAGFEGKDVRRDGSRDVRGTQSGREEAAWGCLTWSFCEPCTYDAELGRTRV
eukprot:scaffold616_cov306-Pavlova_lutheri.AAC.4